MGTTIRIAPSIVFFLVSALCPKQIFLCVCIQVSVRLVSILMTASSPVYPVLWEPTSQKWDGPPASCVEGIWWRNTVVLSPFRTARPKVWQLSGPFLPINSCLVMFTFNINSWLRRMSWSRKVYENLSDVLNELKHLLFFGKVWKLLFFILQLRFHGDIVCRTPFIRVEALLPSTAGWAGLAGNFF